jgi:hypothetical protein
MRGRVVFVADRQDRTMSRIATAISATLVISYAAAFLVYGLGSAITGLQPPGEASPAVFLLSIPVVKLGLAAGFVLLFSMARATRVQRWPRYALIWWITFAITEVGQAIAPGYSGLEAGAGIVAEASHFPLAAW